jgi:predicted anti-sigma-YlaC factor YlaD
MKEACRETRTGLQSAFDRGTLPDAATQAHLRGCDECRAFARFLSLLNRQLPAALDAHIASWPKPDAARIGEASLKRKTRRRIAYSFSGLAAAIVLSLAGIFSGLFISHEQTVSFVREENSQFVDELVNRPVFEGIEYITVSR